MAKIDENTYFLAGGYRSDTSPPGPSKATFFYDMTTKVWTEGPQMQISRSNLGCEVFMNKATNSKNIVLIGGYDYEFTTNVAISELLDLNGGTEWTFGPKMYKPLGGLASVSLGDSVIAIGGMVNNDIFADDISELVCDENGCTWELLEQKLEVPRAGIVAMLIPDELAEC